MEAAKQTVKDFVKKHGQKDTSVHEEVAPAVTHERVEPTRHEEVTTAVDKEVHQHHHHTSVQPIHDSEVRPEKHSHNVLPVEKREFQHGAEHDRTIPTERYQDERVVADTKHTTSAAPVVGSEHVHHHVHETIQPVVQKETIQPEVVHTTVPVHEVHENAPKHHATSALPAVSMAEYKAQGGALGGRGERQDHFEGEPRIASGRGIDDTYDSTGRSAGLSGNSSSNKPGLMDKLDPRKDTSSAGLSGGNDPSGDNTRTTGAGLRGGDETSGAGLRGGNTDSGAGLSGRDPDAFDTAGRRVREGDSSSNKPGLMDKLNPSKDADGDGKKGVFD